MGMQQMRPARSLTHAHRRQWRPLTQLLIYVCAMLDGNLDASQCFYRLLIFFEKSLKLYIISEGDFKLRKWRRCPSLRRLHCTSFRQQGGSAVFWALFFPSVVAFLVWFVKSISSLAQACVCAEEGKAGGCRSPVWFTVLCITLSLIFSYIHLCCIICTSSWFDFIDCCYYYYLCIHPSSIPASLGVCRSLSQLSMGEDRVTPWTSWQFITESIEIQTPIFALTHT